MVIQQPKDSRPGGIPSNTLNRMLSDSSYLRLIFNCVALMLPPRAVGLDTAPACFAAALAIDIEKSGCQHNQSSWMCFSRRRGTFISSYFVHPLRKRARMKRSTFRSNRRLAYIAQIASAMAVVLQTIYRFWKH